MAAIEIQQTRAGRSFWLAWTALTLLGWVGGGLLMFGLGWGLAGAIVEALGLNGEVASIGTIAAVALGFGIGGAVAGVIIGGTQWALLRDHLAGAQRWIGASALGHGVGIGIGLALGLALNVALGGGFDEDALPLAFVVGMLVAGAIAGLAQWRVLRRERRGAVWWVVASTIGLGALFALGIVLGGEGREVMALGAGGLAMGLLTGPTMTWLLRQPQPSR